MKLRLVRKKWLRRRFVGLEGIPLWLPLMFEQPPIPRIFREQVGPDVVAGLWDNGQVHISAGVLDGIGHPDGFRNWNRSIVLSV